MKKIFLTLGLCMSVAFVSAQDCSDLFFSEYVEGSGNNKGMEIYNPTDQIIDLGDYYVARYSNGGLTYDDGGITQLQGFLQPYSTHFLVNGQLVDNPEINSPACDPALQALGQQLDHDYPAPTYMNGNDAIALFKDPVGNGDKADFQVVDLFGMIGGGMQKSDQGWANFTDAWAYKNIYEDDSIVGRDSVYIQNYIVPDGYYWLPWTKDHSLVRKASVMKGVTENPDTAFVVTMEWDTVPGGANAWDSIGMHICKCTSLGVEETGFEENLLKVYPNPARDYLRLDAKKPYETFILYDASGRELLREDFESGKLNRVIPTSGYSSGFYHLRVNFHDRVQVEKVLIL